MKTLITIVFLIFIISVSAQEPYQKAVTKKIILNSFDTVKTEGQLTYGLKCGVITNEDIAFDMIVYFSYPGKTSLDPSSLVYVPPGKSFRFCTYGMNIFRKSAAATPYDTFKVSQVYLGRDISSSLPMNFTEKDFEKRDFTGAVIANFDLTGCNFLQCNFTGAVFVNCILENCDFVDATGITDEELVAGARLKPDGSGYTFSGIQGDTVTK